MHTVSVLEAAKGLASSGISFAEPEVDLDKLRETKDKVISKLTGGLSFMAKARKVDVIVGTASFKDNHHFVVQKEDGSKQGWHLNTPLLQRVVSRLDYHFT